MAAIQLMWACGITACAIRVTSEYSFTEGSCWLVAGFELTRVDSITFETRRLNHSATALVMHRMMSD